MGSRIFFKEVATVGETIFESKDGGGGHSHAALGGISTGGYSRVWMRG